MLSRLGYGTARRVSGCTTEGLRAELADWAESDDDRGEGTLVLYYTGHGDRSADDRHYLLCRDSRPGRLKGTALATEDVVGIVTETGLRRLLLIIDTCYAGQGSVDAVRELARSLTATREAGQHRLTSFSVIAAARPLELAADGAFAAALRDAVDDPTLGGPRQRKLFVEQVVDRVNELLAERSPGQHATFGTLCGDEVSLFPNPGTHRTFRRRASTSPSNASRSARKGDGDGRNWSATSDHGVGEPNGRPSGGRTSPGGMKRCEP